MASRHTNNVKSTIDNPQPDDNFTRFTNFVLGNIYRFDFGINDLKIFFYIMRYSWGYQHNFTDGQTQKDMCLALGADKAVVSKSIKRLAENKVILFNKNDFGINKYVKQWKLEKLSQTELEGELVNYQPAVDKSSTKFDIKNDGGCQIINQELTNNQPAVDKSSTLYNVVKDNIKEKKDKISPSVSFDFFKTWNDFAKKHSLAQINALTKGRKDKLNARLKESSFDFKKILEVLSVQDFAIGKVPGTDGRFWKVDFDWIIKNDTNYVKILEEKYRNTGKSDKHEVLSTQKKMEQEINEVRRLNGLDYI